MQINLILEVREEESVKDAVRAFIDMMSIKVTWRMRRYDPLELMSTIFICWH